MAATKKSPSEKPSGDTVGFGPHASLDHAKLAQGVQIIGLLEKQCALLTEIRDRLPKPHTGPMVIPGVTPLPLGHDATSSKGGV